MIIRAIHSGAAWTVHQNNGCPGKTLMCMALQKLGRTNDSALCRSMPTG